MLNNYIYIDIDDVVYKILKRFSKYIFVNISKFRKKVIFIFFLVKL